MDMVWVWAIVIALSLVIEFITMQMVSIWLALGGVVGLILALIGGISIEMQIAVMVVASLLAILFLRKFTLKFLNTTSENKKADILIGKKTKMIEPATKDDAGTIKINGVVWTATSDEGIAQGEEVEVIEINGNKLKVKKVI